MCGLVKQGVRRRLGASASASASSTGSTGTTPMDGVLRCVPEDNGGLFGNLNI